MRLDTLFKFGSLALNIIQDEKVQQFFKIAHNGAKRRGFFNPPEPPEYIEEPYYTPATPSWHPRRRGNRR